MATENPTSNPVFEKSLSTALALRREQGQWQDSLAHLNTLHDLVIGQENPEIESQVLVARGFTHRMLGNYEKAKRDFVKVQIDLLPSSDHQARYQALIGLADIYRVGFNDPLKGHVILYEALLQDSFPLLQAKAFDQAGLLWSAQDKVSVSILWYQGALAIANDLIKQSGEELSDQTPEFQELVANFYTHLGVAQETLGQESAADSQETALEIYQAISKPRGQLNALSTLGKIHTNLNHYQKALRCYELAADFTGGNKRAEAGLYLAQTQALLGLKRVEDANTAFINFQNRLGPDGFTQHDQNLQRELIARLKRKLPSEDQQE